MNTRILARLVVVCCVAATLSTLAAPVALAATGPTIAIGTVPYGSTNVVFDVAYPIGTGSVQVDTASGRTARATVASVTAGTVQVTVDMAQATSVVATARDEGGGEIGTSDQLPFDGTNYAPSAIVPDAASGTIVGRYATLSGYIDRRTTWMTISVDGKSAWGGPVTLAVNRFELPRIRIPADEHVVVIGYGNAWGRAVPRSLKLFNLAEQSLLRVKRFVLVDKSNMGLYVISGGRVVDVYPVAIGKPGTPTREGVFKLGGPRPASGAWGVLRMALLKLRAKRWSATGYYIHGNNDWASIGTQASHGCVRMYNSDVRKLARIGWGMWVQIRS